MTYWMNLPEEYRKGKFVILPIAYEKDLTYGDGASKGPTEIIKASEHLEYYDDQFNCEAFEDGIELLDELQLNDVSPEEMVSKVSSVVEHATRNKFPIIIGGDHSVSIGVVNGLEKLHNEFSVIQFDAHADFRDSWTSQYNHACVSKQISKKHSLLNIGVRSMDIDEKNAMDAAENVHILTPYNLDEERVREILPKLKDKVYITIDVDVFDPSFIRNTGTPEPGGLGWYNVLSVLKIIFESKNVIGADIVEFAPKVNFESEAYALAKLVYKIMCLEKR